MDETRDAVAVAEKSQEESVPVLSPGHKEKTSSENSEYDSVDSYSDEDEAEEVKARSKASGLNSRSASEDSVILEREEGDGQESVPSKKVDDDEDKKNPQYIPKRGTFYEHDDRTAEDVETQETEAEKSEKEGKKKVWQDKKERWSHDRFNNDEQAPKSRDELIATYGYDIRTEEGPPRARRRRRYGKISRGPNKYTRNWEDEDAYTKPPTARVQKVPKKQQTRRKDGTIEEFPPLGGERNRTKSRSSDSNQEESFKGTENEEKDTPNKKIFERQNARKENQTQAQFRSNNVRNSGSSSTSNNSRQQQIDEVLEEGGGDRNRGGQSSRIGSGRFSTPRKEIKDSDYRGFTTKTRQQRGIKTENQKVLPPRKRETEPVQTRNFTNKSVQNNSQIANLEKEINQLNIQDGVYRGGKGSLPPATNQNRQGSVPPRLQQNNEPKGSKRYSSMRQRSLPETNTPPGPPNFSFYPSDYNSTAPPPATQQPILPTTIPPPTAMVSPQAPVSGAPPPLLQPPFAGPGAFGTQPPPAYLPAPPPPFIAAPPSQPQIVSYVTQPQPAFVQNYPPQFNAVSQPAELYQAQGGITYYSTDQQIVQRAAPPKRPKAAIPIVAPTDFKEIPRDGQSPREEASSSLTVTVSNSDPQEAQE